MKFLYKTLGIIFVLVVALSACSPEVQKQSLATPTAITITDYPDNLSISISGTASNPKIYDGHGQTVNCISIIGNYVEVRNFFVIGCNSHGIYVKAKNIVIENNTVINAEKDRILSDGKNCSEVGGWGSGIKVHVGGENIIIRGNTVYENCGEGIAVTRGINVLVENNIVRDNFSVNIYVDNSNFVTVRNNQVSCTGIFLRNGNRPAGIANAEEEYADWGLQRHDNKVLSNFIDGCYVGISSWDSEASGGKEIRLLVEGNTIRNTYWIRSIDLKTNNADVIVRNNITDKLVYVRYLASVALSNNVIEGVVVTPSRTPTRTNTPTKTITPSVTVTTTRTPSLTNTPTPTKTITPTLNPNMPICVKIIWDRVLNVRYSPSMFNAPYNVNIFQGAIVPVEKIFTNPEGQWAQINKWMYFAMDLNSNDNIYAIEWDCE